MQAIRWIRDTLRWLWRARSLFNLLTWAWIGVALAVMVYIAIEIHYFHVYGWH
jgi:hypothetical protein